MRWHTHTCANRRCRSRAGTALPISGTATPAPTGEEAAAPAPLSLFAAAPHLRQQARRQPHRHPPSYQRQRHTCANPQGAIRACAPFPISRACRRHTPPVQQRRVSPHTTGFIRLGIRGSIPCCLTLHVRWLPALIHAPLL